MTTPELELMQSAFGLGGGTLIGFVYFKSLWWNARAFASGEHWLRCFGVQLARFAILGVGLACLAHQGAIPLLAALFGIILVKSAFIRRVRPRI